MGMIDRWLERRGFVRNGDPVTETKAAGFMELETAAYPDRRVEVESLTDYRDFIDAYRQLPWIYAGATAIAIAAMKTKLRIYREVQKKGGGQERQEITGEDVNRLLAHPNDFLSYRELIQITILNLAVTGNQPWNLVGTKKEGPISATNKPIEIWWVKPEQITVKAAQYGGVEAYIYTGPTGHEKPLDPSEVIHFRMVNPDSYFMGMGMVAPAKTSATLEFSAQAFNQHFLENDGKPPVIFEHPGNPSKEQRQQFWAAWDERHKGPKRAGRAGMTWGGMKIHELSTSPKDAQYIEMRKMNREEILACMGVPPSVVGLLEYANYSNMEIQQRKFWEDTVIPYLGVISDKLTLNLGPHFGPDIVFDFDLSNVKALQENEEGRARTASILIGNGIKTPNQIRREMYSEDEYVGGDQYYMGMSLVPVGRDAAGAKKAAAKRLARAEGKAQEAGDEATSPAPKPSFWRATEERAKTYWGAFEKRVSAKERALAPEIEKYLHAQAVSVKAAAGKHHHLADIKMHLLFDVETEVKSYLKKFKARYVEAFKAAGEAGVRATKGQLYLLPEARAMKDEGDTFEPSPEQIAELMRQITLGAKYFNDSTWEIIKTDLEKAGAENWTVEELTQHLWEDLDGRAPYEARRISQTEMSRTENWGQIEGYKDNQYVDKKGWLCSFLPTSREPHMAASGEEVNLNDSFIVDGEHLDYPGDQAGSAGNVINCHCTTFPVIQEI
jgi:HK97 family phage portal protein